MAAGRAAVRDFAKLRIDRANARMSAKPEEVEQKDPVTRLRERAENMATSAVALKKIADAADPLYKTLDDGQKRRLAVLTHHGRFGGGEGGWRLFRARHDGRRSGSRRRPGRRRPALAAPASPSSREPREGRRIPAAFPIFRVPRQGRENPAGLLDIGGSLC